MPNKSKKDTRNNIHPYDFVNFIKNPYIRKVQKQDNACLNMEIEKMKF